MYIWRQLRYSSPLSTIILPPWWALGLHCVKIRSHDTTPLNFPIFCSRVEQLWSRSASRNASICIGMKWTIFLESSCSWRQESNDQAECFFGWRRNYCLNADILFYMNCLRRNIFIKVSMLCRTDCNKLLWKAICYDPTTLSADAGLIL